jgi:hypothetical protein
MTTETADKATDTQQTTTQAAADTTKAADTTSTQTTETAKAGDPWYAAFGLDDEARTFLAGKGAADPATAIKSWMSADKLVRDRNALDAPDVSNIAGWQHWDKLGWVSDPAKYQVELSAEAKTKLGEAAPFYEKFHADVVKQMHENRVPLPQARKIADAMLAYQAQAMDEVNGIVARDTAELEAGLKRDWGQAYDANREMATRAMKTLGIGEQDAAELDALVGSPKMVQLFHKIGAMMGEDKLVTTRGGSDATVDQARAAKAAIENDPAKMKALNDPAHPQHAAVKAERERLQAIIFGGKAA